jgi:hypothetical protein
VQRWESGIISNPGEARLQAGGSYFKNTGDFAWQSGYGVFVIHTLIICGQKQFCIAFIAEFHHSEGLLSAVCSPNVPRSKIFGD